MEKPTTLWISQDHFFDVSALQTKIVEICEEEGLIETKKALEYAFDAHRGQYRKNSIFSSEKVPYIVHPMMITCHAHALGIREDSVLATAMLHDVCEDCGVECSMLPFSPEVQEAVRLLTKKEPFDVVSYFRKISGNGIASIVKILDRCNNVSTMAQCFSIQKLREYIEETEDYVIPLIGETEKKYPQYSDALFGLRYQILAILDSVKILMLRN
ncbi:MAG: bifunctional (p)ppGpp synthetase/guanosine-3',5'-bis(diphosphate) 3'-pyrophosphohydrolase [Oscillospiraceae bacterium]|nr:bifunctional (p)ppGpp synthetase/guanosine-3',5'-bis(diphosphate) 3'-pyrophosphohydrolase [Oscillospiraceae bacterium]